MKHLQHFQNVKDITIEEQIVDWQTIYVQKGKSQTKNINAFKIHSNKEYTFAQDFIPHNNSEDNLALFSFADVRQNDHSGVHLSASATSGLGNIVPRSEFIVTASDEYGNHNDATKS